ncbi:keratinocyte-associated protein 3-like isoform X3 [Myxocyprinus asiaticus]|uniref:keratinocyte-associated protein 3-like isoform X3 n=1 Tax=Myxocyprinus asiaticus TaxID=70543 RepID=UPI002221F59D|nr:keratinocyte-associated protein 3-like isoform X3 [Myxocyprinus asiaticus]
MVNSGVCCGSLKDNKILMKMGLGLVLVGHVNFLLGALVHGAVLGHIKVLTWDRKLVYPISNVTALVAGLVAIIGGISAIVLSKNKKNQLLGTTLILWFPLILMSVVEVVFSCRCFLACTSFLRLRCPWRKNVVYSRRCIILRAEVTEETALPPGHEPNEEEPTEQHDLLDKDTPVVVTSDWL